MRATRRRSQGPLIAAENPKEQVAYAYSSLETEPIVPLEARIFT